MKQQRSGWRGRHSVERVDGYCDEPYGHYGPCTKSGTDTAERDKWQPLPQAVLDQVENVTAKRPTQGSEPPDRLQFLSGMIFHEMERLRTRRSKMLEYAAMKLEEGDFHGIQDAGSDLRDIEAAMEALVKVEGWIKG